MITKLQILELGLHSINIEPTFHTLNENNLKSPIYIHARQICRLCNATHRIECSTIEDGFKQLIEKAKLFDELSNIGKEPEKSSYGVDVGLKNNKN